MAENNEYHIYLHYGNADGNKSAVAGTGTGSTGKTSSQMADPTDKLISAAKTMVSFAAIKSTADKMINFEISQVSLRTGAMEYEQRLNATYSAISQTVGAGAALVGAGITGGPVGVAVATLGLAVSVVNKIIGISNKAQNLRTEQSLENISIGMAVVRAGVNSRRSDKQ